MSGHRCLGFGTTEVYFRSKILYTYSVGKSGEESSVFLILESQ